MNVKEKIVEFVVKLEEYLNTCAVYARPQRIEFEYGRKYCRVTVRDSGADNRSVYCFIDLSNGDILKSASWKVPAKGARGSIFNENCDVGRGKPCNEFGSGLYR